MSAQTEEQIDSKYFDQVPEWPNFKVLGDEISGRVPVTRVAGWRELPDLLDKPFFNPPKTQLIFRGHRRYDWPLTPSLGRFDTRKIITQEVAEAQLRLFRRAVRGRISDHTLVDDHELYELWSVGQHHGLFTPLLDWTYSPYVALFFAFEKDDQPGELDNPYRAIYVLNKSHVEVEDRCPDVSILEPRKDDHGRLVNQAGLFTYSSYDNTLENFLINSLQDEVLGDIPEGEEANELAKYICKIYIPNDGRADCLRHLRMMNVHHASLFPDLLGASQYCNVMVAEESIAYRQAEIERTGQPEAKATDSVPETASAKATEGEVQSLREVLAVPEDAAGVEPARLDLIAQELATELAKVQYVDWEKRERVKAAMRNAARVVLRRLGYPTSAREAVLDQLLGAMNSESDSPSG
ncbi:MAG: FRG domain-containing protein [Gammaproteobacteria bacterium]|nr:FRG domain-containing protein [Gammaproteobacteria bacterium]